MNIENLFEDLEAQFESQISAGAAVVGSSRIEPEGPVLLEIYCFDQSRVILVAPTIGADFVAGVNRVTSDLTVISLNWIKSVSVHHASTKLSLELKKTGHLLAEFCQLFVEPKFQLKLYFLDQAQVTAQGHIVGQLMSLIGFRKLGSQQIEFVPSVAIAKIEHSPVNN